MCKSTSFHDRYSSRCFKLTKQPYFGCRKSPWPARPWIPATFHSINMCAGIVDGRLIGPYLLPPRLMSHIYRIFLQKDEVGELLEDVSLDIRRRLWFQHDVAPPHFAGAVHDHLNRCFGQRWIDRGGPIRWPPRSSNLPPLHFFFCGATWSLWYIRPCGLSGRSTCANFGGCTGNSTDTSCNGASVPEHEARVQCVQWVWWSPYWIAVVVDKY